MMKVTRNLKSQINEDFSMQKIKKKKKKKTIKTSFL